MPAAMSRDNLTKSREVRAGVEVGMREGRESGRERVSNSDWE